MDCTPKQLYTVRCGKTAFCPCGLEVENVQKYNAGFSWSLKLKILCHPPSNKNIDGITLDLLEALFDKPLSPLPMNFSITGT